MVLQSTRLVTGSIRTALALLVTFATEYLIVQITAERGFLSPLNGLWMCGAPLVIGMLAFRGWAIKFGAYPLLLVAGLAGAAMGGRFIY